MRLYRLLLVASMLLAACGDESTGPTPIDHIEPGMYVATRMQFEGDPVDLVDIGIQMQVTLAADSTVWMEMIDTAGGLETGTWSGNFGTWRIVGGALDLTMYFPPSHPPGLFAKAVDQFEFLRDGDALVGSGVVEEYTPRFSLRLEPADLPDLQSVFPHSLEVIAGAGQSAAPNATYAEAIEVRLLNGRGDPIADFPVWAGGTLVDVRAAASSAWQPSDTTVTDAEGRARFEIRAESEVGTGDVLIVAVPGVYARIEVMVVPSAVDASHS
jgi:hypothetical protein